MALSDMVVETGKVQIEPEPDWLFVRLTADKLARAIIGDARAQPTQQQLANAQELINRTGTLYRLVAGFRLDEWEKKP